MTCLRLGVSLLIVHMAGPSLANLKFDLVWEPRARKKTEHRYGVSALFNEQIKGSNHCSCKYLGGHFDWNAA